MGRTEMLSDGHCQRMKALLASLPITWHRNSVSRYSAPQMKPAVVDEGIPGMGRKSGRRSQCCVGQSLPHFP
jgi:hypothetical protein